MKKVALAAVLASTFMVSAPALAEGWRLLPILSDKNMTFDPTLALTVNRVDPKAAGMSTASAYGLDLNFNCGLIQDPQNRMRTHLNISRSEKNGTEVMAFELSPRYTVPLGNGFSAGVGPSLAVFNVESATHDERHVGVGVATGLNYRNGAFYAGADLRYHATNSKSGVDFDNLSVGVKVGVNF